MHNGNDKFIRDLKKLYPNQSHKQEDLVSSLLGASHDAHNAPADVISLGQVLTHESNNMPEKGFISYSFAPKAVSNKTVFNQQKTKNPKTLEMLTANGACKRPTLETIAGSGLNVAHLKNK